MRPVNSIKTITSSTFSSGGQCVSERTLVCSGPSYGKISGGFGPLKFFYEGENPISNMGKGIAIGMGGAVILIAAGVAIPITIKWSLKKLGIIDSKENDTYPTSTNSPIPALPTSKPMEGTFAGDVARAISKGKPNCLMTEEIIEGSRIILFSSPGVGKSILVAQMAFAIASGKKPGLFPDEVEAEPQNVLLIDTEQEDEDLYLRYNNGFSEIPENITRVSNCQFNSQEEVTAYIWGKISEWTSNGTVIIDNITSAFSLQSPERIRLFYNQLRSIQDKMKYRGVVITLLCVCHETKSSTKLSLKSLQGSGNLGNFATVVYGLERGGEVQIKLHVLKNRRSKYEGKAYLENRYEEPYLRFKFQNVDSWSQADKDSETVSENDSETASSEKLVCQRKCTDEQIAEMRRLYKEGMSINKLHQRFNVNPRIVRKYLGLKH